MNKKTCILSALFLFMALCIAGCLGPAAEYPDKETASKDTELMAGLDETVSTPGRVNENEETQENEDLQELKHWKYGKKAQSVSEATEVAEDKKQISPPPRLSTSISTEDYSQITSIQILTAEEMDEIMSKLISAGYLSERAGSQEEFQDAVAAFQNDQGISGMGELNGETRISLRNI